MTTDSSLLGLVTQASFVVQLVMAILTLISLLSWTIIFQRAYVFYKAQKRLQAFSNRFQMNSDLNRLYDYLTAKHLHPDGIEQIIRTGFREFIRLYKQKAPHDAVMQGTERVMRIALTKEEEILEQHLAFLASAGSISVYIGLLGTVWGIMTAFRALGQLQQATLAMVAPGISEALIATALGLFAAIPAVFAYNRYFAQSQKILRNYDNLAEEFFAALHRRLHNQPTGESAEGLPIDFMALSPNKK